MWCFFRGSINVARLSVSSIVGAAGGFFAWFLGGIDTLLVTLVTFIVIDYVTGVIRAIYEKKLSSAIGFRGIIKKILMLIMVGVSVSLQQIMPSGIPLREMTVMFFITNEGFSILENGAGMIPLPQKLKSVLLQLQDKADGGSDGNNDKSNKTLNEK